MKKREYILSKINNLVKAACGCTEIGVIALVCAQAKKHLPSKIVSVELQVSQFIYKNVARVGVPKVGHCGIGMIACCGIVLAKPQLGLNIMSDIRQSQIEAAKKLCDSKIVKILLDKESDPVFAKAIMHDDKNNKIEVLIEKQHDNVVYTKLNNKIIDNDLSFEKETKQEEETIEIGDSHFSEDDISIGEIMEAIKTFKLDELEFLQAGINMNQDISDYGFKNNKANFLSEIYINHIKTSTNITWKEKVIAALSSAIDARMEGSPLPVMCSSNSGDHGLTVFIPINVYAKEHDISKLLTLQALSFAHIITAIIKQKIGDLSAYCGTAIAATTGAIAGIGFLRGYTDSEVNNLINLMICSTGGVLCDGAKLSCSYKAISAINNGFLAMEFVENKGKIKHLEGINSKNARETINNLGNISQKVKNQTNSAIVDVMNEMENKWKF